MIKWLDKNFEYICLAGLLIVMTVLSFTNVVLRYVFNNALSWSDEVSCYCLAISAFISLSCSIRYRSAIRVDTLISIMPKALQSIFSFICNGIMVVFIAICIKGGLDVAANAMEVNQKSPALQLPVAILYYLMTFFFALALFRTIQTIVNDIRGKEEKN
jgi:TRAP-type C4-dicarboxylate transport system permease small subunit